MAGGINSSSISSVSDVRLDIASSRFNPQTRRHKWPRSPAAGANISALGPKSKRSLMGADVDVGMGLFAALFSEEPVMKCYTIQDPMATEQEENLSYRYTISKNIQIHIKWML